MKSILTIVLSFLLISASYAQDDARLSKSEIRKLQREQKKAEQAAALEAAAKVTEHLVNSQRYVLEADYLSNKTGVRVSVLSQINFIMVDSMTATFQFGSAMEAGYNGVGGATFEGRISRYEVNRIGRNNDSWSIRLNIMSSLGSYDITLMIGPDGKTDATVRGNWGNTLNYTGQIVSLENSRVYKGAVTY